MNIGLFYGSSTCYTEMAAEKIRDIIGPELVTLHNLKDDAVALMEQYDVLILGIPTWDFGEIQEDWEAIWDQLDSVNLDGKIVAMYGMGDQLGYGEWFLDALGMLHDKLAPKGVSFIGYWPTEGYEFTSKKPIIADGELFVGLALDETNQYDLSDERLHGHHDVGNDVVQRECQRIGKAEEQIHQRHQVHGHLLPLRRLLQQHPAQVSPLGSIHTVSRQPQMLATPAVHLA